MNEVIMPADTPERSRCTIVFHDGSCALCQREIGAARRLTQGAPIAFVDVSVLQPSESVATGLSAGHAMRRFHVQTPDGRLLSGAAAFLELWGQVPRLGWLRHVQRVRPLVGVLDAFYALFLVFRPPLSRLFARFDRRRSTL